MAHSQPLDNSYDAEMSEDSLQIDTAQGAKRRKFAELNYETAATLDESKAISQKKVVAYGVVDVRKKDGVATLFLSAAKNLEVKIFKGDVYIHFYTQKENQQEEDSTHFCMKGEEIENFMKNTEELMHHVMYQRKQLEKAIQTIRERQGLN